MRIRKKHNVNEKLLNFDDIVISAGSNWKNDFANKRLFVELGTGKGDFISQLAEREAETNFIGLEVEATVVYAAARKIREKDLTNVRLMVFDINHIEELFGENEVDRFYINFCDPWPKKRHAKRRLTNIRFLEKYRQILRPEGEIQFKTDNRDLFEYSLEQFELINANVSEVTFDLHAYLLSDNIETEYEKKFSGLGVPICRCVIKF